MEQLDAKSNTMKQHNNHVLQTKSYYENKMKEIRNNRFMKTVTKQLSIDRSISSRLKEQNVYQNNLRTRNEEKASKALNNVSDADTLRSIQHKKLMQKLAA